MEYVAHTLQNALGTRPHPDVPYLAPELVLAKEYPVFGNDPMLIAAFCDACMMGFHPAQTFFNNIERMKLEQFVPGTSADVYAFVYDKLKFSNQDGVFSPLELYDYMMDKVIAGYDEATQSPVFAENNNWMKHIFSEARLLRHQKPGFMTELVAAPGQLSNLFYLIFRHLGTPFFTNKTEKGGFVPPAGINYKGIQPYQLLVFKEIINVFTGSTSCGLYKFCKNRPDKDITDQHCLTAPWKRGISADLCPFGQFWKTWGLSGETPVP